MKNAQLKMLPIASLVCIKQNKLKFTQFVLDTILLVTQQSIGVQPSMVTHWNTVNMAKMMLSNDVIPLFGPSHFSRQTDSFALKFNQNNQTYHDNYLHLRPFNRLYWSSISLASKLSISKDLENVNIVKGISFILLYTISYTNYKEN